MAISAPAPMSHRRRCRPLGHIKADAEVERIRHQRVLTSSEHAHETSHTDGSQTKMYVII